MLPKPVSYQTVPELCWAPDLQKKIDKEKDKEKKKELEKKKEDRRNQYGGSPSRNYSKNVSDMNQSFTLGLKPSDQSYDFD